MSDGYNTDIEKEILNNVDIELGEVVVVGGGLVEETDPTVPSFVKQITQEDITSWNSKASSDEIPTKTSELTNDSGFITGYTESDPTVPSFVKNITQGNINSWNAKAEKGDIPHNVSELTNDKGYITSYTETDPTVPSWAKQPNKPNYSYDEITGKPTDLATQSYVKNEIANAQLGGGGSDIDLSGYATKDELNGKADKYELNNYVTNDALANKGYLTSIPDEYVTDTELSNKGYLTAVPNEYKTKSENDELYQEKGNYLTEETDPSVPAYVKNISENDISNWNNKSEFSGSYDDLTNKPTIPTVPTDISAFNNDKGYLTSVPSEYVTETELAGKGYATTTELENSVKDKATTSYVDKKVADLVNSAPETLDTLGEVATAIQNNASVVEALNSAIGNKVDKVSGKGLSTNDYTTEEKNKLSGLSNYNDTEVRNLISGKADKSAIPTKVSELTNDSNYLTSIPSEYVTETELSGKNYTTIENMNNSIKEYSVAKNQGLANVGKILVVGTDGNLTLTDMPEGGGVSGDVIGTLDESNNILLSGNLENGTYYLKYENTDGTYTEIGTLEVGSIPEPEVIVNWLPISTDSSGAVYNGTGYKTGVRLKSDGVTESTDIGYNKNCVLSGYIPAVSGDVIKAKNIKFAEATSTTGYTSYIWLYDSSFAKVGMYKYQDSNFAVTEENGIHTFTITSAVSGVAYIRLQAETIDDTTFVAKNQEIV